MVSYLPDESEGYLAALKKYGFCVVKVLSTEDCDATVKELMIDANIYPGRKHTVGLLHLLPLLLLICFSNL